eukprot:2300793-Prymnesium_polylepis.1
MRGPTPDFQHEEFVKCLRNSCLNETELDRRIRRGRPITEITKPKHFGIIEKKKPKTKKATGDIEAIIASVKKPY